jgi:hypothetical protein
MATPSALRTALRDYLKQHGAKGVAFEDIQRAFPKAEYQQLMRVLSNMRQCGEAHNSPRHARGGRWFTGPDDVCRVNPSDSKREKRAGAADRVRPLIPFGEHLPGGRCASVWDYAQHLTTTTHGAMA